MKLNINLSIELDRTPIGVLTVNGVTIEESKSEEPQEQRTKPPKGLDKDFDKKFKAALKKQIEEEHQEPVKPEKKASDNIRSSCPGMQCTPGRFTAFNASFRGTLTRAQLLYESYIKSEKKKIAKGMDRNILSWKEWLVKNYRKSASE